jgi:putative transposase
MARQLRIEFPGANYHIFSRGNQKQPIFLSDDDRHYFLKILRDTHDKFGITYHAYCLMPNHYHLGASTPRVGLAKAMHFTNTAYAVYINRKHNRCGHLFQGRYRSVLVEAGSYMLGLSRYIHLNPVRAGLVASPDQYPWSSFPEYAGIRRPYPWLDMTPVLGRLDADRGPLQEAYMSYVRSGIEAGAPSGYYESKSSGILGGEEFIDVIRRNQIKGMADVHDRERPQLEVYRHRASLAEIFAVVNRALSPHNNLVKCAFIYIGHRRADYTLAEIASFLNMSVLGVSNARRRAENEVARNGTFARAIDEMSKVSQNEE